MTLTMKPAIPPASGYISESDYEKTMACFNREIEKLAKWRDVAVSEARYDDAADWSDHLDEIKAARLNLQKRYLRQDYKELNPIGKTSVKEAEEYSKVMARYDEIISSLKIKKDDVIDGGDYPRAARLRDRVTALKEDQDAYMRRYLGEDCKDPEPILKIDYAHIRSCLSDIGGRGDCAHAFPSVSLCRGSYKFGKPDKWCWNCWSNYEIKQANEKISKLQEALIWCGGSDDFALEGKARIGWEKGVKPLLDNIIKRASSDDSESDVDCTPKFEIPGWVDALGNRSLFGQPWQIDSPVSTEVRALPLSASEAVYGFCAWLTTVDTETIMSAHHDAGRIAELISTFCEINNFAEPREDWAENLVHPSAVGPNGEPAEWVDRNVEHGVASEVHAEVNRRPEVNIQPVLENILSALSGDLSYTEVAKAKEMVKTCLSDYR